MYIAKVKPDVQRNQHRNSGDERESLELLGAVIEQKQMFIGF